MTEEKLEALVAISTYLENERGTTEKGRRPQIAVWYHQKGRRTLPKACAGIGVEKKWSELRRKDCLEGRRRQKSPKEVRAGLGWENQGGGEADRRQAKLEEEARRRKSSHAPPRAGAWRSPPGAPSGMVGVGKIGRGEISPKVRREISPESSPENFAGKFASGEWFLTTIRLTGKYWEMGKVTGKKHGHRKEYAYIQGVLSDQTAKKNEWGTTKTSQTNDSSWFIDMGGKWKEIQRPYVTEEQLQIKLQCVSTPTKGRGMASLSEISQSYLVHTEEPYAAETTKEYIDKKDVQEKDEESSHQRKTKLQGIKHKKIQRIEKSENVADISKKYRISDGAETIIVTDYRSTEKSTKKRQNRRYIGEISAKYRFIGKFPDIFLPVQPAHRIQNLAQKSWI
uniref:Uncharacterized protein n=1 Tax=Vitis vinifera TaxID=29760 RepID=A5AND5_VITVI|nr:hypothetical protein VITISV_006534 [Vitis vinifera]